MFHVFEKNVLSIPFLGFKVGSRPRLVSSRIRHVITTHCRKLDCVA
jgi:hypothetical protein